MNVENSDYGGIVSLVPKKSVPNLKIPSRTLFDKDYNSKNNNHGVAGKHHRQVTVTDNWLDMEDTNNRSARHNKESGISLLPGKQRYKLHVSKNWKHAHDAKELSSVT